MEHVEDWRGIISNFKRLLRPGGIVAITTRSRGFGYHGYPADYWRYEVDDMRVIFEDFKIQNLITDPSEPGVFIKAKRPMRFKEKDLSSYNLYAITKDG
jgi:SAM-dependent methyltransferase